ncbi:rhodanese-like domain-containing protein [Reinekea sp.]|jgi:phage shock protein E|uniref:rhodanese-like domain-containing protein n=2 Tax=Reinekea sp. TaxID=1970455 RepID=UPI003988ECBF
MFGFLKKLFQDDTTELTAAISQGGTIIDVRSAAEFSGGSAPGAINYPHDTIGKHAKKIAKMPQPIILCCASGMRSGVALGTLKSAGITNAINGKTHGRVAQAAAKK